MMHFITHQFVCQAARGGMASQSFVEVGGERFFSLDFGKHI